MTDQQRDDEGQFMHRDDRMCVCGHTHGNHTAHRTKGRQPCIMGDYGEPCDCKSFRKVTYQ